MRPFEGTHWVELHAFYLKTFLKPDCIIILKAIHNYLKFLFRAKVFNNLKAIHNYLKI
jgi:hypothetical protein